MGEITPKTMEATDDVYLKSPRRNLEMEDIATKTTGIVKDLEVKSGKLRSTKLPQFVAALTVGIISFSYGCGIGWLSPTLPLLQSSESPIGNHPITEEESSWISSLPFLGAVAASPFYSYISQHFGRKIAGYATAVPMILNWIFVIFANDVLYLYVARFLAGIAYGGTIVFVPMYCGEIAEDSIRGALNTFLPLICNFGTLFTYSIGPYISFQVFAIILLLAPITFLFGYYWLPETPVYLTIKGKHEQAAESMLWLRSKCQETAERDLEKIKNVTQRKDESHSSNISVKALFFSRGNLKALAIISVICTAQQFSGVFVILNNCTDIMAMSGSALSPDTASIFVAAMQFTGSFLSSAFVELVGRKTLLIVSQVTMSLCLAILGTYFYFQNQGADLESLSVLPMICVSLYLFALSVGLAPVTFVLISELFHPDIKGIAATICTSMIWALAFIVTKLYPVFLGFLEIYGCYWGFATICTLCLVFEMVKIPETKGRTLESILLELNGGKMKITDSEPLYV